MKYILTALLFASLDICGASAQTAPSVTGNCNAIGNNNSVCNNMPPRLQTGLYQNGERIGVVQRINVSPDRSTVTLTNLVISASVVDLRGEIELQGAVISCPALFDYHTGMAQTTISIIGDTVCNVLRARQ
jgi:hypothetical protein